MIYTEQEDYLLQEAEELEPIEFPENNTDEESFLVNDKAILTRMLVSTKQREAVSLKILTEKKLPIKEIIKTLKNSTMVSSYQNDFCVATESILSTCTPIDTNDVIDKISTQLQLMEVPLSNTIINANTVKENISNTLNHISNHYCNEIRKLNLQISNESKKGEMVIDFKKITELSSRATKIQQERDEELFRFTDPERWLVQLYNDEKHNYFRECIQSYLQEQLYTFKALALGSLSRKSESLENLSKVSETGTKIGVQILDLSSGTIPGICGLGFISTMASVGRSSVFYKDESVLLAARNILKHSGRRIKDIVDFSIQFSDVISFQFKNQIHHFTFSSIELLAQLLVEQIIPIMIHLKYDSNRDIIDTIHILSDVSIPREYINSFALFDKVICSLTFKTENGNELNAWRYLRKSSFKSKPSNESNWEYAISKDKENQRISIQLESFGIDCFRELSYQNFERLFEPQNKILFSKYTFNDVIFWKETSQFNQNDDYTDKRLPEKIMNSYFMSSDQIQNYPMDIQQIINLSTNLFGKYMQITSSIDNMNPYSMLNDPNTELSHLLKEFGIKITDRTYLNVILCTIFNEITQYQKS